MTTIQFLTSPEHGCCTTAELLTLSREDKPAIETLKGWAREEMTAKGIPITERQTAAAA